MTDITVHKIIRAHRSTVGMQILPDASLVIKIPWFFPKSHVMKIVQEKEAWIRAKQQQVLLRRNIKKEKKFKAGEEFLYLGKSYPLEITHVTKEPLDFADKFLLNTFNQKNASVYFTNWYKKQALSLVTERVRFYAYKYGLTYRSITLSSATTRWGSCTHDNHLFFNWTLIMAPPAVIDYVVAHELAHTVEKNHSRKFWTLVGRMFPEYRPNRRYLKEHGTLLSL